MEAILSYLSVCSGDHTYLVSIASTFTHWISIIFFRVNTGSLIFASQGKDPELLADRESTKINSVH